MPYLNGLNLSTLFALSAKLDRGMLESRDEEVPFLAMLGWDAIEQDFLEGFESVVTLGMADGRLLFDFDLPSYVGEALKWHRERDLLLAPLLAGANLPAWAAVPIKDRGRAERFLKGLEERMLVRGRKPESGTFSLKVESYDSESASLPAGAGAFSFEFFAFKLRVFYLLAEDALLLAVRPETLADMAAGSHRIEEAPPFHGRVSLFPKAWREIRPDLLLTYEEAARRACMDQLAARYPFNALDATIGAGLFGAGAACPDGGSYSFTGEGEPVCDFHGMLNRPAQPLSPTAANAASKLLQDLEEVTLSLRLTSRGIRTRLQVIR